MSDITVSSTAFLSFEGVLSSTNGRSSSTLAKANSYCSFVILFILLSLKWLNNLSYHNLYEYPPNG